MFNTVLSQSAQLALDILGKSGVVNDAYLAGGSALALRLGHRISVDFDFFSEKAFDSLKMAHSLSLLGTFVEETREQNTLLGTFNRVKFSYFTYPYSLLVAGDTFKNILIASINDIAAMKLAAIMDRGTKRDFIDLFVIAKHGTDLDTVITLYDKKYHAWESNKFSILKALYYFDDAETSSMPEMRIPLSWDEVKRFFTAESVRLGKKYLEDD